MPTCEEQFAPYSGKAMVRRARYALKKFDNDKKLAKRYLRELTSSREEAWNKRQLLTVQQYNLDKPDLNTIDDYRNKANSFNDAVHLSSSELSLKFLENLKKEGVSDVARNPRNHAQILGVSEGEIDPKTVEDKQIVKVANILIDHRQLLQRIAKEYGVEIDDIDKESYFGHQFHDDKRIFSNTLKEQLSAYKYQLGSAAIDRKETLYFKAQQRWINVQKDTLNWQKTFFTDDENVVHAELEKDFDERHHRFLSSKIWSSQIKVRSKMADMLLGPKRTYHYNSSYDWTKYQNIYGVKGLVESVIAESQSFARKLAFMKHYGPNGEWTIQKFEQDIKDKGLATGPKAVKAQRIVNAMRYAAFQKDGSGSYTRGLISQGIMSGRAIAALGKMYRSIGGLDIAAADAQHKRILGRDATMKDRALNVSNYVRDMFGYIIHGEAGGSDARSKAYNELTGHAHLAADGMFNRMDAMVLGSNPTGRGTLNPLSKDFYSKATLGQFFKLSSQLYSKLGLVTAHHRGLVKSYTFNLGATLAKYKNFSDLDTPTQRMLSSHMINEPEYNLWSKYFGNSEDVPSRSVKIANTDAFHQATDEEMINYLRSKGSIEEHYMPDEDELNRARQTLQARAAHMYLNYERLLVPTFDYSDKVAQREILDSLSSGGRAGKALAAIGDQALMFKGYGIAFFNKVLRPMWDATEASPWKRSGKLIASLGSLGASYFFWGNLFSSAANLISGTGTTILDAIEGDDPRKKKWAQSNLTDPIYSLAGIWGDTARSSYEDFPKALARFLGPGVSDVYNADQIMKHVAYNHKKFGQEDGRRIHTSDLFKQASEGVLHNLTPWYLMRLWHHQQSLTSVQKWKDPTSYYYKHT